MNITWKKVATEKLTLPHRNIDTSYSLFKTEILEGTVPIYVLQSPETRRVMIGVQDEKKFIPGRLYLGMPRAIDLSSITYTMASTDAFKSSLNSKYIPEKESISVMLMRETVAQSPFLNVFLGSGYESRLYAVLDIHHVKDKKGLKGLGTRVCTYRIDMPEKEREKISKDIKIGVFYDSIAGGRNLKKAFEELKEDFPNLEKVIFFSIYATYEGCKRISECCKKYGVQPIFFCAHELLKANSVNEYDCFYPVWNISKDDECVLNSFYGKNFREICVGGDFTANVFGIEQAKDVFFSQIKILDVKIQKKIFEVFG